MIKCIACDKNKSTTHFYRRSDNGIPMAKCKLCVRKQGRRYRIKYPGKRRDSYLLKKYGLTEKRYQKMFESQSGRCAMCHARSERALSVDHDHQTGKVRGLLCGSCNALLGFAQEDISILKEAIDYLMQYNQCYRKCSTENQP